MIASRYAQFILIFVLILASSTAEAAQHFGRVMTGGYFSSEKFSDPADGTSRNDFSTISSRLFLRVSEIGDPKLEWISDIRDQHDFFEKLDRERLELTPNNNLQVRQLSIKYPNPNGNWFFSLGRFPLVDAGSVNVDGAELAGHFGSSVNTSVFGGLDPKRPDQTYFHLNRNSRVFGTYTLYRPKETHWNQALFASAAVVGKQVGSHWDRIYLFTHGLYEWDTPSQVQGFVYLDFVPKIYVQNGFLSYTQKISASWSSTLQGNMIDVIEYSRRRGMLETLSPSPYREGAFDLKQKLSAGSFLDYHTAYGWRASDSKQLIEGRVGPSWSKLWNSNFSAYFSAGYRKNFTSRDVTGKLGGGYYSKQWELALDEEGGIRREEDGKTYHPIISELSLMHLLSRDLFGTLGAQHAYTEKVMIWSGFLKIGYRFGSKDLAPLRDGAPPRGRL